MISLHPITHSPPIVLYVLMTTSGTYDMDMYTQNNNKFIKTDQNECFCQIIHVGECAYDEVGFCIIKHHTLDVNLHIFCLKIQSSVM